MLEKNSDHSEKPQGPASDKQRIEELYSVPNWEERLEAARAQRERALARHLEAKKSRKAAKKQGTPDDPALETDTEPSVAMAPAETAEAEQPDRLAMATDRFGRSLLVSMACFASLGFGLAVGVGTLFGIGAWQSTPVADAVTPEAAPPVQQTSTMYAEPVVVAALPEPTSQATPEPVTEVAVRAPVEIPAEPLPPAPLTGAQSEAQPDVPEPDALSLVAWLPLQPVVATDAPADPVNTPITPPDPLPGAEWTLADKLAANGVNPEGLDLRVYAPDAVPNGRLESNMGRLADTGLAVENLQRVDFAVSTPHIRYYNAEDSATAEALAAELRIEARDFTEEQSGPVGLIEVWFAGVSKTNLADELAGRRSGTYLFDRLRDKLRSE